MIYRQVDEVKFYPLTEAELVEAIAGFVTLREGIVGLCKRAVTFNIDSVGGKVKSVTAVVRFEPMTVDEVFDAFSKETGVTDGG